MQDDPGHNADHNQQHERHGYSKEIAVGQETKKIQTAYGAEPLRFILGDEAGQAAIEQQPAQRDNERLHVHARNQQPVDERKKHRNPGARQHGNDHAEFPFGQHHRHQHAEQRHHRTNRKFDPTGDDYES